MMQPMGAPSSEDFPSAIMLARMADVVMNNNVLHRMVRPTEQGTEVVSVNRLTNVVPFRRIYRFDRKDEVEDFSRELLRRPLVMQPVVHFGRGLGKGSMACGMCYKDDKWIMMINQTHPKILSRLQIGLDAAKSAIARGQSCEIKFKFSKMVEKIYKDTLTKAEQENAAKTLDLVKSYFRYAEWEYGDLIIRYHGLAALMGRGGGLADLQTVNMSFSFEDLVHDEITWKTLGAEFFPKPHLAPVTEDEIRECLPAWTVNEVSPLEEMGDKVPSANYSYSQAGRLYESFRKKKRHPRPQVREELEASGGAAYRKPTITDGIELQVMNPEGEENWQHSDDDYIDYDYSGDHRQYSPGAHSYDDSPGYSPQAHQNLIHHNQQHQAEDEERYLQQGAKPRRNPQHDSGHFYPEVKVNYGGVESRRNDSVPPRTSPSSYNPPSYQDVSPNAYSQPQPRPKDVNPYARTPPGHDYPNPVPRDQFTRLRMQGSDRSSHSEAGSGTVDSGVYSDNDGHVREGSYEKPVQKHSPGHPYAMDNHGFHHEDDAEVSEAMRKHKELIAKMMGGAQSPPTQPETTKYGYHDSRQQQYISQGYDRDDGYYRDRRNPSASSAYSGSQLPSPGAQSGQYDYMVSGMKHSQQANGYSPNADSRQQVDESFI